MWRFLASLTCALLVFIVLPDNMMDRLMFKPLPERAVQIGRTRPPNKQEEKGPLMQWRSDMSNAFWALMGVGPGGGSRFEMTYEGTRLQKEGESRISPGLFVRPDPPVWTEISSY